MQIERVCKQCGGSLPADARFCEQCGEPWHEPAPPPEKPVPEPIPSPANPPATPPPLPPVLEPIQAKEATPHPVPAPRPPSAVPDKQNYPRNTRPVHTPDVPGRSCVAMLASGCLVLLIGAGIGAAAMWFYLGGVVSAPAQKPMESPTPVPTATPTATPTPVQTPPPTPEPTPTPAPEAAATPPPPPILLTTPKMAEAWIAKQGWIKKLAAKMPKGVTISVFAKKDGKSSGWMIVEIREIHGKTSRFDPKVSPKIGTFKVSTDTTKILYYDVVRDDYVPLEGFLRLYGISSDKAGKNGVRPPVPGSFETPAKSGPNAPTIQADPLLSGNGVAVLRPDTGFVIPSSLPQGTRSATVSLRVLVPANTRITQLDGNPSPGGVRLRVRVYDQNGNSAIQDAIVVPSGVWKSLDYPFSELPPRIVEIGVEAIWNEGPIYVDDVGIH